MSAQFRGCRDWHGNASAGFAIFMESGLQPSEIYHCRVILGSQCTQQMASYQACGFLLHALLSLSSLLSNEIYPKKGRGRQLDAAVRRRVRRRRGKLLGCDLIWRYIHNIYIYIYVITYNSLYHITSCRGMFQCAMACYAAACYATLGYAISCLIVIVQIITTYHVSRVMDHGSCAMCHTSCTRYHVSRTLS